MAKRAEVELVTYRPAQAGAAPFRFRSEATILLRKQRPAHVLAEKLKAGGLDAETDVMRARELAAEYHLFEEVQRRPDLSPALLQEIEPRVLGETVEAHLRARGGLAPYGAPLPVAPRRLAAAPGRGREFSQAQVRSLPDRLFPHSLPSRGLLANPERDIAEVQTAEGKLYLYVAIDRTSKSAFVQLVRKTGRTSASAFLAALIRAVSYRNHTMLTDNGIRNYPRGGQPGRLLSGADGAEHGAECARP